MLSQPALVNRAGDGVNNDHIRDDGGGISGHHHQLDVHHVPSLHEKEVRIPTATTQRPLQSPRRNSADRELP